MRKSVFVSSTYRDLKRHRDEVHKILADFNVGIVGMEKFGARKSPPLQTCLSEVEKCSIYLGIIAMNYGSVDVKTGKSFTQLEYEKAVEKKLDIRIFLIDEKNGDIKTGDVDFEKFRELENFKKLLRTRHTIVSFGNATDLAQKVFKLMQEITKDDTYKRPPVLKADLLSFSLNGKKCNIVVGKYNGRPVEIHTLVHEEEFDYLDPDSDKDVEIVRQMCGDEEMLVLQFRNKKGYKTTIEGIRYLGESDFRQFDIFLSALLQKNGNDEFIKAGIEAMNDDTVDLSDWKKKLINSF
jgi:hypothetical protein